MAILIAAIDPGVTGAVAWITGNGLIDVSDLPMIQVKVGKTLRNRLAPAVLSDMIGIRRPDIVYLEEVATRPGEGAVGAFSFGRGFGQIEGVLAGMGISCVLVKPQAWKKRLSIPADKGAARLIACRLWPAYAKMFARIKDDGRAEAALIGLYGIQVQADGGVR